VPNGNYHMKETSSSVRRQRAIQRGLLPIARPTKGLCWPDVMEFKDEHKISTSHKDGQHEWHVRTFHQGCQQPTALPKPQDIPAGSERCVTVEVTTMFIPVRQTNQNCAPPHASHALMLDSRYRHVLHLQFSAAESRQGGHSTFG
jgi:hypothetical protein